MISNSTYAPVINALVEELGRQGLHGLSELLSRLFDELMKAEREQVLQAGPYERTEARKGYANGFKDKTVQTRFGKLELQVPQTRDIAFYPQCLEKGGKIRKGIKIGNRRNRPLA
jgi:putative transposase